VEARAQQQQQQQQQSVSNTRNASNRVDGLIDESRAMRTKM
jgi:hypothetical protein